MSGGSHDYICYRMEELLCDQMEDAELNDLMQDICELAHDLEWYCSGDTCRDDYMRTVKKFKKKWFGAKRNERLAKYIVNANNLHTATILRLLGEDSESDEQNKR